MALALREPPAHPARLIRRLRHLLARATASTSWPGHIRTAGLVPQGDGNAMKRVSNLGYR